MIQDCTAIILAGGESKRMGRDKANILLGEQTLLQHVISGMQQIFPEVIVSVRKHRAEVTANQIYDSSDHAGPLAGLVASLNHINTPWAFVVACDMPFINPNMIKQLAKYRQHHQAVVPVIAEYKQPLAAFYARNSLNLLQNHLDNNENLSLCNVLEKLSVCYVKQEQLLESDPKLLSFFDLDTPQDYVVAQKSFKAQ